MPIEITMPRLSDTMEMGTVIKWNVSEGDTVSAGDVIADIETDKATMEMQAFEDGTITKLLVPEGKTVEVGTVLATLAEEGEAPSDGKAAKSASAPAAAGKEKSKPPQRVEAKPGAAKGKPEQKPQADERDDDAVPQRVNAESSDDETESDDDSEATSSEGTAPDRVRISPLARRLAEEHDVDVRQIRGSGPGGRIIKRDVLNAIDAGTETRAAVPPSAKQDRAQQSEERQLPARVQATRVGGMGADSAGSTMLSGMPALREQQVPLSQMRQTIARRLVESKQTIPHYQVTVSFNMDPLLSMRQTLNEQLASQGVKLSVNDFLVRCCALAMYENPEFNASWEGDHLLIHGEVNVGVAIALPRERGGGLVVATIRNADQKSLRAISAETKMLSEKARTRGLSIEEMSDSTFTISNLGMFGVEHFTAIINPPNSAILAVGAALEQPVVRNGQLTVGHEMRATLSSDHRVIDGAIAAQYLASLKQAIENPAALLV
jgi:pyruvate dehydrogenase E2 component (dihydrolipoamide acetyltransferase)